MNIRIFIFFVLSISLAFVYAMPTGTDDDGCNVEGVHIKKGEYSNVIGDCQRTYCAGYDTISATSCGMEAVPPGSKCKYMPLNPSKPYPACCPHFYDC